MSDRFQGGILAGATSVSVPFVLRKTADNTEQTGKVAVDMTGSYWRQGAAAVTSFGLSDLGAINSAYASGGVKEVDAVNEPGLYRLDIPDAAIASGADWVVLSIKVGASYVFHERFALTTNVIQTTDTWTATLEGSYTAQDLLRIIAAVAAGKTTIAQLSPTGGTVTFRDVTDASDIVTAEMTGPPAERATVILAP